MRRFDLDHDVPETIPGVIETVDGRALYPVIPRKDLLVNEVRVATNGTPAAVELYNVGAAKDLAGHVLSFHWQGVTGTTPADGSFNVTFPSGLVIPAYSTFTIIGANGTSTATTVYIGTTIPWSWTARLAVTITSPTGDQSDAVLANGFSGLLHNDTRWIAAGPALMMYPGATCIHRTGMGDTDWPADWTASSSPSIGVPNPGQVTYPVVALWTANRTTGTWNATQRRYDPGCTLFVQLENKGYLGAPGAIGSYFNWTTVEVGLVGMFTFDTAYLRPGYYNARYWFPGNAYYLGSSLDFRLDVGNAATRLEYMNPDGPGHHADDTTQHVSAREYENAIFTDQAGEPFDYVSLVPA